MKVVTTKDTGKNYRVANGQLVTNEGATRLAGKSLEGGNMAVTAQVAAVTKPLAAANEIADADNWIILRKKEESLRS